MYFRIFKLSILIMLMASALLIFTSCKKEKKPIKNNIQPVISTTAPVTDAVTSTDAYSSAEKGYDGNNLNAYIILDDEKTTINGTGVTFENGIINVSMPGTYFFTGRLTDGKIYVNSASEDEKVKLVFGGVDIGCSSDAAVYIENSPKETVIILEGDTVNHLSDTSREIPEGITDYATAVIYSKDDLQFEGVGTLNITAKFNKGIFSKNDIKIKNGIININSVDDAIRGKDGVEIEGGTLNLVCGGDGIRTSELTQENKGDIVISGGTFNITSDLDGIQAVGNLEITGGSFNITSGGGATGSSNSNKSGFQGGMFPSFGGKPADDSSMAEADTSNTSSMKSMKSDKVLTVSNGSFTLSSCDDTLHAPYIYIGGGNFLLESDDDGIHGDEAVNVSGGIIDIAESYEGVEGKVIDISGGSITVKAGDDGFNAASPDSNDRSGMGNDGSCIVTVTGGYIFINADGDGLDSNGSVIMSGGTMIIYGPENGGNGALDYGGSFTVSGGTLLATGNRGMAQSVTGNGVTVLNYNSAFSKNTVAAIIASDGSTLVGFKSPKSFSSIVFASERIVAGESYSLYEGGSFTNVKNVKDSVCFDGTYIAGSLAVADSNSGNNRNGFMR